MKVNTPHGHHLGTILEHELFPLWTIILEFSIFWIIMILSLSFKVGGELGGVVYTYFWFYICGIISIYSLIRAIKIFHYRNLVLNKKIILIVCVIIHGLYLITWLVVFILNIKYTLKSHVLF
jgi:hypothetical protein